MKTIQQLVVMLVLTGLCVAQPVSSDSDSTAKKTDAHATKHAAAKAAPAATAEDIKQLKDLIQAQQAEAKTADA